MSTKTYHVYDLATGDLTGAQIIGSEIDLVDQLMHLGPDTAAFEGPADYLRQRVNLFTGQLEAKALEVPEGMVWSDAACQCVPLPSEAVLALDARERRAALLTACDWTQVVDSPLTTEVRAAWSAYRQALRDITDQAEFPGSIDWPTPPA